MFRLISSVVLIFIGYNQTDRQAKYIYINKISFLSFFLSSVINNKKAHSVKIHQASTDVNSYL